MQVFQALLDSLDEFYHGLTPSPYGVIFVSGYMTDQKICEIDWEETRITISVNFLGPVRLLNTIANNAISSAIGDPSSVPYQLKYQYL
mgnify:CR=1 FL=1